MNKDVIIVGGGVVGLSAALAMHQRGFSVALLDAGSLEVDAQAISPRVYAINPASQALFQQLQVWEHLDKARISPYRQMHVWDAVNGAHIDFDARMVAADRLGSIIDEANLRAALLQKIRQHNIALLPLNKVTSVQELPEGVVISCEQTSMSAKLMIVADGACSPTRQLLGVPLIHWPYHQHALVTTVQTEIAHQHTAFQVFSRDGTLAFLPLGDLHQCSIVWSSAPHHVQQRMLLSPDLFNAQLTTAFMQKLGQVTQIGTRYQFPLEMRHVKHYCGAHWLLMGDAAHTIHPLAGLGLNIGLADLGAWLALLDKNKHLLVSKKMLSAYQRNRKHAVWQKIILMEGIKVAFLNPLSPIAAIRGMGLNLFNHLTPIKRFLMEQAAK